MAGKRVDLSQLADDDEEQLAPVVRVPALPSQRTARLGQLAPNPLNTRDISRRPDKITEIADSLRLHGQIEPCAVVTRAAFLRAFPEHDGAIGNAAYVQVTGGRRLAAASQAGLAHLDIVIKDEIATTRAAFSAATAAENLDREDLDPVEEAHAVAQLTREAGTGKAVAEQLSRTPAWVTQRLNLLKLVDEVQAALRDGEIPIRQVRDWHTRTRAEQLAALAEWGRAAESRDRQRTEPAEKKPKPARPSVAIAAVKKLGGTPEKVAVSLRAEMSDEFLRALVRELLADLPDPEAAAD